MVVLGKAHSRRSQAPPIPCPALVPIHVKQVGAAHLDMGPAKVRGCGMGGAGEGQSRAGAMQGGKDEGKGVAGMSKVRGQVRGSPITIPREPKSSHRTL